MTPEELTDLLREAGAIGDARVVAARPSRAAGIAVTSRVVRLHLEYDRPAPGAPDSVVVKTENPDYGSGPEHYLREVAFFRDLAGDLDLAIPRCYHAGIRDGGKRFVLVLEDLSEVRPGHPLEGCGEEETRAVLTALADLHAAWWESPRLAAMEGWRKGWPPERVEYLRGGYDKAWPRFLERGEYEISPELREIGENLLTTIGEEFRRIDRSPRTLIHNDLHVENLLLERTPDGLRPCFLDWQCAALGPPALDVMNAVGGNARPEVLRESGLDLLTDYLGMLGDRGVSGYALEDLLAHHRAAICMGLLGEVWFLSTYTPESEHDRRTIALEWERTAAAAMWLLA